MGKLVERSAMVKSRRSSRPTERFEVEIVEMVLGRDPPFRLGRGGARRDLEGRVIVRHVDAENTVRFQQFPGFYEKRGRVRHVLQNIVQLDGIEASEARRRLRIEEAFGHFQAQRTGMRGRLPRGLDAQRFPAAGLGRPEEEAGAGADIEQAPAVGRQKPLESLQAIVLRELRPVLIFAGMRQEGRLFVAIIGFAVGRLERARIGSGTTWRNPHIAQSMTSKPLTFEMRKPSCDCQAITVSAAAIPIS